MNQDSGYTQGELFGTAEQPAQAAVVAAGSLASRPQVWQYSPRGARAAAIDRLMDTRNLSAAEARAEVAATMPPEMPDWMFDAEQIDRNKRGRAAADAILEARRNNPTN